MSLIKLSFTSKMDGIPSWSLQAFETCPGAVERGAVVPVCKGCYARAGNYAFPQARASRAYNKQDWQRAEWAGDMVAELRNYRYFRWFDSGDMYSLDLAEKILLVMQQTPWMQHWLPTRMHKFAKFAAVIERMQALPNVVVRASADNIGEQLPLQGSMVVGSLAAVPAGAAGCRAYERGGKCAGCRACWDKDVHTVAYVAHGAVMKKLVPIQVQKIAA